MEFGEFQSEKGHKDESEEEGSPSWNIIKDDDDVLNFSDFADIDKRPKEKPKVASNNLKKETIYIKDEKKRKEVRNDVPLPPKKKSKAKPKDVALGFHLPRKTATELWSTLHSPSDISQLVVHSQRVNAVREWLKGVGTMGRGRVMVLSGPMGCGKTSTLRCAAAAEGIDLRWWRSPVLKSWELGTLDSENSGPRGESALGAFRTFVRKASIFNDLSLNNTKTVVVVNELPWLGTVGLQEDFAQVLGTILGAVHPFVFVLSAEEQFSLKSISPDFAASSQVTWISFNPIPPTKVRKVLTQVAQQHHVTVPPAVMQLFCERSDGDLRSAITALQFYALGTPRDRSKGSLPPGKDPSLSLFHAVGKILYPKRLPGEFPGRPPLAFSPEEVIRGVGVEGNTFVNFLHENYLPFLSDWDSLLPSAEWLSLSDSLPPLPYSHSSQESEYGAVIATRGLLWAHREGERKFQAIHRPELHSLLPLLRSTRQSLHLLRRRGPGVLPGEGCSAGVLFCEVLPFVAKIRPVPGTALMPLLRSLGTFSPPLKPHRLAGPRTLEKTVKLPDPVEVLEEPLEDIQEFDD